jgi:heme exporter protein D
MLYEILIGWCTIHALIWFSLAVLVASIVLYVNHVVWERRSWPKDDKKTERQAPSWVR